MNDETEQADIKLCYICEKEIEDENWQAIPFAEDGMVHEVWYAHQKCYNEQQQKEIEEDFPEMYKETEGSGLNCIECGKEHDDENGIYCHVCYCQTVDDMNKIKNIFYPHVVETLEQLAKIGIDKNKYVSMLHFEVKKEFSRTKVTKLVDAIIKLNNTFKKSDS